MKKRKPTPIPAAKNEDFEAIDRKEAIEGIRRGLEDFRMGRFRSAKEAMEEIRRKHKIPRNPRKT
jgi:predicted transcriptional regulator